MRIKGSLPLICYEKKRIQFSLNFSLNQKKIFSLADQSVPFFKNVYWWNTMPVGQRIHGVPLCDSESALLTLSLIVKEKQ